MEKQATFNRVVRHARKQRKKAEGPDPDNRKDKICMYRAPGGRRCFAGALIPNTRYSPEMEGKSIAAQMVRRAIIAGGHNVSFVLELQTVHDAYPVRDWERQFCTIAKQHRLRYVSP